MIGAYLIKFIRKIVSKAVSKASTEKGVVQFIDSFVKIVESGDGKLRFIPTVSADMTEFSKVEHGIVDDIISRFGGKSSDELTEVTHEQDSLWSKVVRENGIVFDEEHKKSDIDVKLEELLDLEGLATYNDAKESMEFQAALNRA